MKRHPEIEISLIKQRNVGILLTFRLYTHEKVLSLWREVCHENKLAVCKVVVRNFR